MDQLQIQKIIDVFETFEASSAEMQEQGCTFEYQIAPQNSKLSWRPLNIYLLSRWKHRVELFDFASTEYEPTYKEDEYWFTHYPFLSDESRKGWSSPSKGKITDLKEVLQRRILNENAMTVD